MVDLPKLKYEKIFFKDDSFNSLETITAKGIMWKYVIIDRSNWN